MLMYLHLVQRKVGQLDVIIQNGLFCDIDNYVFEYFFAAKTYSKYLSFQ